ncbi:hypothetical protein CEXT_651371 [Caerostris extrusa]|uniref:Uncharacterized protein n=1 Tax=Caerostris extrusa TaxID=172846 RepID=A0AAV4T956_CAEEX|nr:hypothetical protein CEXT_651371 [Caerostris extrusa]
MSRDLKGNCEGPTPDTSKGIHVTGEGKKKKKMNPIIWVRCLPFYSEIDHALFRAGNHPPAPPPPPFRCGTQTMIGSYVSQRSIVASSAHRLHWTP